MATAHSNPSSPERIFHLFSAYQRSAVMKGAIELDLFSIIARGNSTVESIAEACGGTPRGVRILCDFLTVEGLLTKHGSAYRLAPDAEMFLNRDSRAYIGDMSRFLLSPLMTEHFRDVAGLVRNGGGTGNLAPEHPIWIEFARGMMPMMVPAAQSIAAVVGDRQPCRVLDIAASHGLFGVTIAQSNPVAQIVALDWPNVLQVARENAEQAGVSDRFSWLAGSAFDVDYGSGYDVVLLTNFLHHFDVPTNETLLRKVAEALRPGGICLTLEFVPNEDRVSPPAPAMFAINMLASTPAGDAYTFSEFESMFAAAGFASTTAHALQQTPETLLVSTKP